MLKFNCGECGVSLKAPESKIGKSFPCPKCSSTVTVPGPIAHHEPPKVEIVERRPAQTFPPAVPVAPIFVTQAPVAPQQPQQHSPFQQPYPQQPFQQQPQNIVVNVTSPAAPLQPQSQVIPAIVNFFFPSIGYLLQGRLFSFCVFWMLFFICFALIAVGIGLILIPLLCLYSVYDAATYQPRSKSAFSTVLSAGVVCVVALFGFITWTAVVGAKHAAKQRAENSARPTQESAGVKNLTTTPESASTPLSPLSTSIDQATKPAQISENNNAESMPAETPVTTSAADNELKAANLLNLGKNLQKTGKDAGARKFFQDVIARHPGTEAAKEAAELLK